MKFVNIDLKKLDPKRVAEEINSTQPLNEEAGEFLRYISKLGKDEVLVIRSGQPLELIHTNHWAGKSTFRATKMRAPKKEENE